MEWSVLVTLMALAQFVWFGIRVGQARAKGDVQAPAMTGTELFDRRNRVHGNTLEQLVVFIPSLWAFSAYVHPLIGAGLGVVFLIGRFMYATAYEKDPQSRGAGFGVTFLPVAILLLGGVGGAIWRLVQ
ncbi:MAG: MAPEG family protein [Pseudomonadota bacterium]